MWVLLIVIQMGQTTSITTQEFKLKSECEKALTNINKINVYSSCKEK